MTKLKNKLWGVKSLKVKTSVVYHGGSKTNGEYMSNAPQARNPATPVQTAATVVDELGRIAELCHDSGAEVALSAVEGAYRAWDWKSKNDYEHGESPSLKVLMVLAEKNGYHLVPFFEGNGHLRFQDDLQRDIEETRGEQDYEALWESRWKEICLNEDGTVNLDAVKRELSDYSVVMSFYSTVLSHVTGGRVSKLLTWPSVINSVVDDRVDELVADETRDLQKQLEEGTPE